MALNILQSTAEEKVDAGPAMTNQTNSAVAALKDGGWVVTWASSESTGGDIYGRLYESDGGAFGSDFVVNKSTSNAQSDPDVAGLPNGGWVVTWTSLHAGDALVMARTFDGGAATAGNDLLISTPFVGGTQRESSVATFADDSFVVAWSANLPGSTNGYDLKVRKFSLDGTALTDVSSDTSATALPPFTTENTSVVAESDGGWSVATDIAGTFGDTTFYNVTASSFSSNGDFEIDDIPIGNSPDAVVGSPDIIRLANGERLVVFHDQAGDGSGFGIYQAKLAANGEFQSSTEVNTYVNNDQKNPKAAALEDGGYVVVWQSKNQDGSGWGIYQQRYDANGAKIGAETPVTQTTTGNQLDPDVAALPDGGWVVTWTSDGTADGTPDIYQRRFTPGIVLDNASINENNKSGAQIGVLSPPTTADGQTLTYSVMKGSDLFAIGPGNKLFVKPGVVLDHESGNGLVEAQIKATAPDGSIQIKTFTIEIRDVDEAPTGLVKATGGSIEENKPGGTFVATFVADDPEGKDIAYSLTDNAGGVFTIDAATGQLKLANTAKLDFEAKSSYSVKVKASDGAKSVTDTFTINVLDVNEGPTVLSLSGTSVAELSATNAVVGTLTPTDPDTTAQTYTYKLANDTGGRFKIVGNALMVDNGVALDFEQAAAHQVTVVVTDQGGLSNTQSFIVGVGDIHNENTSGTGGADTVFGDTGRDVFSGGAGNDVLKGFKNNDTLTGGAGNDRLFGGLGKDTLRGNAGKDVFVFDTKPAAANVDLLKDFSHKDDTIWLENAIFKGIGSGSLSKPKKMKADAFFLGKTAHDANDRILYDKATGGLFYDSDGTGAHAAVKIALLTNKPALSLSDFFVI